MKYKRSRGLFLILACFSSLPLFSQTISAKRGIAYGQNTAVDMAALSEGISWWYNWSEAPESGVLSSFEELGMDFVPMAWNGNFNKQSMRDFLTAHPNIKYILGFNEPNFTYQANMTPSQAAAKWPEIEAIADEFNLKIVAPAVNYCDHCVSEGGVTYSDPIKYLDDFFAACPNCRVDYIAMHSYMNTIGALSWYVNQFKKYHKPIWVTEFAGWESNNNINDAGDQQSFLIGAVDFLESDTSVFRYAWFTGRTSQGYASYPYIDLLGDKGVLTSLGITYAAMPLHDTSDYKIIPASLEAEGYSSMNGILLEKTSDVSGFANCGYIDAGDWLEYHVECAETGTYPMEFRVAVNAASQVDVLVDGNLRFTQSFTKTGGWQNWQTFNNTVHLTAGKHKIRLVAKTAGFNINWLEFKDIIAGIHDLKLRSIIIYPNPAMDKIYIDQSENADRIVIMDVTGQTVMQAKHVHEIDISRLAEGFYTVVIYSDNSQPGFTGTFIKSN